jgi:signal transduction histidine kinase
MDRLPAPVEIALFRILQESLTNVHRHARASRVKVEIECTDDGIILQVHDDGKGIAAEVLQEVRESAGGAGVGLASMNERVRELGGTFQLKSDHGTTVRVRVPVSPAPCDSAKIESLIPVASA